MTQGDSRLARADDKDQRQVWCQCCFPDRFSNETHDGQGEAPTKMDIALFDVVAPPGNLTLRPKAPVVILELGNYCGGVKVGTISMPMTRLVLQPIR